MQFRKIFRMIFNRRAESVVVATVILTGVAVALGFTVLMWGQSRSADYAKNYGQTTDVEIAKLKEKLTVEYVFYNQSSKTIRVFLLNSGSVNDTKVQSVYVRNSTWSKVTSSTPSLKSFNGALIADQDLDMKEEGYVDFVLSPTDLKVGKYYSVRVVTERGNVFEADFIA